MAGRRRRPLPPARRRRPPGSGNPPSTVLVLALISRELVRRVLMRITISLIALLVPVVASGSADDWIVTTSASPSAFVETQNGHRLTVFCTEEDRLAVSASLPTLGRANRKNIAFYFDEDDSATLQAWGSPVDRGHDWTRFQFSATAAEGIPSRLRRHNEVTVSGVTFSLSGSASAIGSLPCAPKTRRAAGSRPAQPHAICDADFRHDGRRWTMRNRHFGLILVGTETVDLRRWTPISRLAEVYAFAGDLDVMGTLLDIREQLIRDVSQSRISGADVCRRFFPHFRR